MLRHTQWCIDLSLSLHEDELRGCLFCFRLFFNRLSTKTEVYLFFYQQSTLVKNVACKKKKIPLMYGAKIKSCDIRQTILGGGLVIKAATINYFLCQK